MATKKKPAAKPSRKTVSRAEKKAPAKAKPLKKAPAKPMPKKAARKPAAKSTAGLRPAKKVAVKAKPKAAAPAKAKAPAKAATKGKSSKAVATATVASAKKAAAPAGRKVSVKVAIQSTPAATSLASRKAPTSTAAAKDDKKSKPVARPTKRSEPPPPKFSPTGQTEIEFTPYVEQPGEEYMNARQAEHFRGILLSWRQQLMEEVERTVHHMQDDASNFPDPNDRATQEEEFALELRTRDRERKLIKKINDALKALEEGDYGYCEMCGIEIGIRRLEARPTATLCIDCKTLDEIRERQRA